MESDSEGSLRDFIDDGDADDTESTESSDRSSSDESDVQVITEGEKKSKSTSRSTRSTRSKGLVEGECNLFIFTAGPVSCLMQSLVYVHCERTRDVSGGRVMHMPLIAKCTDI
jgi:hypothetical protein